VSVKAGSFTPGSTGNVVITGLTFLPEELVFRIGNATAGDDTAQIARCDGWTTASNQSYDAFFIKPSGTCKQARGVDKCIRYMRDVSGTATDKIALASSFSRAEVDTGTTWIDGRTIFKTTFTASVTGSGSEQSLNLNIPPIVTYIVKAEGVINDISGWYPFEYMSPAATTTQNSQMKLRINSGVWQITFNTGVTGTLTITTYYVK